MGTLTRISHRPHFLALLLTLLSTGAIAAVNGIQLGLTISPSTGLIASFVAFGFVLPLGAIGAFVMRGVERGQHD